MSCALAAGHPAKQRAPSAGAGLALQFPMVAQQRAWICQPQRASDVPREWTGGQAQCVWQDRLQMRQWVLAAAAGRGQCVSAQARWWAWARQGSVAPSSKGQAWDSNWTSQALVDERGAEQRILVIERLPDASWVATEWRWNPSPRAATRRWQEGRWTVLKAAAEKLRPPPRPTAGSREMRVLGEAMLANVGSRAAEVVGNVLHYQGDGVCLQIDTTAPGQQQLQVPYRAEDSRLEQRAAMQLQLARRFPKAVWLTQFNLVPTRPTTRGGAKFYAVWRENAAVHGQLWMPTKSDGPLVRVRVTAPLPPGLEPDADAPLLNDTASKVTAELMGLAAWWTYKYE
jgi:hypothetical protein